VDARTIKRDGQFAEAVEVLGLQAEVAAGAVDAPNLKDLLVKRGPPTKRRRRRSG
jgi:hypothetical protein